MAKGEGRRGTLVPKEHVFKVAGGRVTRRTSMMQCVTPTVPIQQSRHNKKSIAAKRVPLRSENTPVPIPNSAENLAENEVLNLQERRADFRNERTPSRAIENKLVPLHSVRMLIPHSTENLTENEVLNPPEKRADTRNEHTSSRAIEREVVPPEPRRALSFNMTEIVQMCNENPSDDEAESSSSCALATFRGYRVSHEAVPMLQKIFEKYGDIAKDSISHDRKFLSFHLEELYRTLETLQSMTVQQLPSSLLEKMSGNIEAMEKMNLNVGWLQKKLTDIKEVKHLVLIYPIWKEENSKIEKERTELAAKKREILVLEEKFKAMEDRFKEISARIEKTKEIFKATYLNNCAHGLL